MAPLAAIIAFYWREQGFQPAAGASTKELAAFESNYLVRLPPNVRAYFTGTNGMADYLSYEYAEFPIFLPLDQVFPLSEIAPDNAAQAQDETGMRLAEPESYFAFADVCYTQLLYAVRLTADPNDSHPVVLLDQTDYKQPRWSVIAPSFSAFLYEYVHVERNNP